MVGADNSEVVEAKVYEKEMYCTTLLVMYMEIIQTSIQQEATNTYIRND